MKSFIKGVYVDFHAVTHIEKKENELVLHFFNSTNHSFCQFPFELNWEEVYEEFKKHDLHTEKEILHSPSSYQGFKISKDFDKQVLYLRNEDVEKAMKNTRSYQKIEERKKEWNDFVKTVTETWMSLESAIKEIKIIN